MVRVSGGCEWGKVALSAATVFSVVLVGFVAIHKPPLLRLLSLLAYSGGCPSVPEGSVKVPADEGRQLANSTK